MDIGQTAQRCKQGWYQVLLLFHSRHHAPSFIPQPGHINAKVSGDTRCRYHTSFQKHHSIPAPSASKPNVVIAIPPQRPRLLVSRGVRCVSKNAINNAPALCTSQYTRKLRRTNRKRGINRTERTGRNNSSTVLDVDRLSLSCVVH